MPLELRASGEQWAHREEREGDVQAEKKVFVGAIKVIKHREASPKYLSKHLLFE